MPARRQSGVATIDPATGLPVETARGRGKEGKEKETFACPFPGCGQNYSRMEYLKRHQRKHQDDRPFQCKDCTKAFARSDVLLRHRRRCHPTPPPTDRNSHSPPAPHRNYPGVPISSSRTDARDASPAQQRGGRKHPRQNSGDDEREANRPRIDPRIDPSLSLDPSLEDDADGEDDERFPDGNRFGRQNGMGNGGVYSATSGFYGTTGLPDGASYTPHLSLFQQNQPYHSLNDPDHLEDASVLLSMAYPGGVPEGENPNLPAELPDWANNPTINMMMEAAVAANREQEAAAQLNHTAGTTESAAITAIDGQSTTTTDTAQQPPAQGQVQGQTQAQTQTQAQSEPVVDPALASASAEPLETNFLNAMSWLSGMDNEGVLDPKKDKPSSATATATASTSTSVSTSTPTSQSQSTRSSNNNDVAQTMITNNNLVNGWMQLFANMNANPNPNTNNGSPIPLSSLFSPGAFGVAPLPSSGNDSSNGNMEKKSDQPATPGIMDILNQLAMYDVPQTLTNPNPERPLLRVESADMVAQAGHEWSDKNSPFYMPVERFSGCYQIPHWALPPIRTLSVMASRTFHTVLNHFSFIHMPTFRLIDTAACLAFAICTVGGIKTDSRAAVDSLVFQALGMTGPRSADSLDGPVVPDQSWESLYDAAWNVDDSNKREDAQRVKGWRNGTVVRSEKTNMLVKSFSLAQGVLMTEYNVALLQSLILYHAPNFLSGNESERVLANMFLGTIVNITRQVGFFTPEADHVNPKIRLPVEPFTPNELDRVWREWIQLETRRRTAYLVYQLDTVSALESNIPCILSSCEVAYLPLPAPDTLWKAPTAWEWLKAAKKYKPMTMDEAMRRTFFLPTYGAFDALHEQADTRFYNLLNSTELGPFARLALVLTLLRGVIDIGEGKRDRGDWRDLTDLWVGCSWLRPSKKIIAQDGTDLGIITRESLRSRFAQGLQKWREGWDFDKLCSSPDGAKIRPASSTSTDGVSPQRAASGSPSEKTEPELPKETLSYCEDALPFYWLAVALLNQLNTCPPRPMGFNHFSGVKYGEMLKTARRFTRMGEGVPGAASGAMTGGPSPSTARQGSGSGSGPGSAHGSSGNSGSLSTSPELISMTSGSTTSTSTSISPDHAHWNATNMPSDPFSHPNPNPSAGDLPAMSPGTVQGLMEALGGGYDAFSMGLGGVPVVTHGNGNGNGNGEQGGNEKASTGGGIRGHGPLAEHLGFIL